MFWPPRDHKVAYFYDVFATPENEFLLKLSKNIAKQMLLDHPQEPVLAMNGKRVSIAPQNEPPDGSLESSSELLFVLSGMSPRRVLWAWVRGDRPRSARPFAVLGHSLARFGAMLGHLGVILRQLGDKMEP